MRRKNSFVESCHSHHISTVIGIAGGGEIVSTRPFMLVTGRKWVGTAFGGVRGRTQLPGIVDKYMGKLPETFDFVYFLN